MDTKCLGNRGSKNWVFVEQRNRSEDQKMERRILCLLVTLDLASPIHRGGHQTVGRNGCRLDACK